MTIVLMLMLAILLIPIYIGARDQDVWQRMLAFCSIATKTSIMILVIAVIRSDWTIGVVGVLILSLGNAALMLLAHILRRLNEL